MKNCPYCAEEIQDDAVKCKHCGEWLDENLKSNTAPTANTQIIVQSKKSKGTAALLAIFLGGIGIHKFYLNQSGWGIVYLLFCWTLIPLIVGFIEGLIYAAMSDEEFDKRYNHIQYNQTTVRQNKSFDRHIDSLISENKTEVKSEGMSNRTLGWLIIAGIVIGFIVLSPMCDNSKAVYKKSGTNNLIQQPFLKDSLAYAETDAIENIINETSKDIERNPNDTEAYLRRALYREVLGNYSEAIQDYNKAIELNPGDPGTYLSRGNAKNNLKDYRGAIQDYNKAIELNPKDEETFLRRGGAKGNLKDYKGAIQDYNKAIELKSNDSIAYFYRGNAKFQLGDNRGAIQDINKAIELNPNFAEAYVVRGLATIELGQKDSGCLDLSKSGELGYSTAYDVIKQFCN